MNRYGPHRPEDAPAALPNPDRRRPDLIPYPDALARQRAGINRLAHEAAQSPDNDAGLPEAVDRASSVFGWQHLVRYSGMSVEWMDATLTAIVREARVPEDGGGSDG